MIEEFTTIDVVHNKIQLVGCLEGVVQIHQERVAKLLKDTLLSFCVLQLVPLDDCFFVQDFHSVDLLRIFLPHLNDLYNFV